MNTAVAPALRDAKLRYIDTAVMVSGGQTITKIPDTEVIRFLNLYLSGTVSVDGGGADGVLTPEGMLSLIRNISIEASSGTRRELNKIKWGDIAAFYNLQKFLKSVNGYYLNPTPITKGSAASPFAFDLQIDFEMARSKNPRATMLNANRDITRGTFNLKLDWGTSADMFSAGTITYPTTPNMKIYALEHRDDLTKQGRYGINLLQYKEQAVPATTTRQLIDLKSGYLLRGVLIKAFTRAGGVYYHTPSDAIINAVSLEVDRDVVKEFDWKILQAQNIYDYHMSSASVLTGYAFLDFMPELSWDTIIDTRKAKTDVNLVLNVTGGATSYVRVYPVEVIPSLG